MTPASASPPETVGAIINICESYFGGRTARTLPAFLSA
jgi:hypothetical protein